MLDSEVTKRYATSLFEVAKKNKLEEHAFEILSTMADLARSDNNFKNMLNANSYPKEELKKIFTALCKKMKAEEIVINFFNVLIDNLRLAYLPQIAVKYEDVMAESKGEERAFVTVAKDLTSDEAANLQKMLEEKMGKKIRLVVTKDNKILAGSIVTIGSKTYDASIMNKITRINHKNKMALQNI